MKYMMYFCILAVICVSLAGMVWSQAGQAPQTVLDFTLARLDGQAQPLGAYRGKVLLLVNVASQCGLTPQYEALQALYLRYRDRGLMVMGFPANDFNGQEPGSNEEIQAFCSSKYQVTFPMFAKIGVTGEDQHPLYRFLTGEETNPGMAGPVKWNFTKFLAGRDGRVLARFEPRVKPDSPEVVAAIEKALSLPEK